MVLKNRGKYLRYYCCITLSSSRKANASSRRSTSPLPHGPPWDPKGTTDAVKVEMEVTSSKDPGDVDVQELTFLTVPPKLLAGAKLVSLHIQIDKLTS